MSCGVVGVWQVIAVLCGHKSDIVTADGIAFAYRCHGVGYDVVSAGIQLAGRTVRKGSRSYAVGYTPVFADTGRCDIITV